MLEKIKLLLDRKDVRVVLVSIALFVVGKAGLNVSEASVSDLVEKSSAFVLAILAAYWDSSKKPAKKR